MVLPLYRMDHDLARKSLKEHHRQGSSSSGYSCPDSEISAFEASTLASQATDYDGFDVEDKHSSSRLLADDARKSLSNCSPVAPLRIQKAARWINSQLSLPLRGQRSSAGSSARSSSLQRLSHKFQASDIATTTVIQRFEESVPREWSNEPLTPTTLHDNELKEPVEVRFSNPGSPLLFSGRDSYPILNAEQDKALRQMRKRHNCIRELYNTEYLFAQDMAVVVRLYMCASADIGLTVRQIDTLFLNAPQILDVSLSLVAILEAHIPTQILQGDGSLSSDEIDADALTRVGKAMCMALNGQLYEVYEDYIHHSQQQLELYYELTKHLRQHPQMHNTVPPVGASTRDTQVESWLAHCGAKAAKFTTAWSLDSLLIKPVQRLGKYPLFMRTLLECTDSEHEDYDNILCGLRRSKHYLDCVNARLGQTTH